MGRDIMGEESWKEESWEESWERDHGQRNHGKESWEGNHGKRLPRGSQEAPRKLPGGSQRAPRRQPGQPRLQYNVILHMFLQTFFARGLFISNFYGEVLNVRFFWTHFYKHKCSPAAVNGAAGGAVKALSTTRYTIRTPISKPNWGKMQTDESTF